MQVSLQQPAFRAAFNLPSPKDLQVCVSMSCLIDSGSLVEGVVCLTDGGLLVWAGGLIDGGLLVWGRV